MFLDIALGVLNDFVDYVIGEEITDEDEQQLIHAAMARHRVPGPNTNAGSYNTWIWGKQPGSDGLYTLRRRSWHKNLFGKNLDELVTQLDDYHARP